VLVSACPSRTDTFCSLIDQMPTTPGNSARAPDASRLPGLVLRVVGTVPRLRVTGFDVDVSLPSVVRYSRDDSQPPADRVRDDGANTNLTWTWADSEVSTTVTIDVGARAAVHGDGSVQVTARLTDVLGTSHLDVLPPLPLSVRESCPVPGRTVTPSGTPSGTPEPSETRRRPVTSLLLPAVLRGYCAPDECF
jgi:hypothetical protein